MTDAPAAPAPLRFSFYYVNIIVRLSRQPSLFYEGGGKVTQFERVYREYFSDVYAYILKLSGSADTAEEITSETFFKALNAIDSFRGDCEIRVWLCRIAKNCYFSHLKKSKRLAPLDDAGPPAEDPVEERLINSAEAERVRSALHLLPEPYKEVFMWRVFAQMSFRQIGEVFGKSENWACVTYHRARKMILAKMEDENNE